MPQKCISGRVGAPDHAVGAYSAPPDPLAGFEGATSPAYYYYYYVHAGLLSIYFSLYILRVVLESPWKVLEFDFDKWARTLINKKEPQPHDSQNWIIEPSD